MLFRSAMTTAAPLRSARANAPPATPVDGFVFEAFEAAFELLSDLLSVALLSEDELSEAELSEAELLVSDEASELLTLSGCEEAPKLHATTRPRPGERKQSGSVACSFSQVENISA